MAPRSPPGIVEYVVFPNEGHGLQQVARRREMNERIVAYLEQHLVGWPPRVARAASAQLD